MSDIQSTADADRILNQDKVEQKGLAISTEKKKLDRSPLRVHSSISQILSNSLTLGVVRWESEQ